MYENAIGKETREFLCDLGGLAREGLRSSRKGAEIVKMAESEISNVGA